MNQSIAGMDGKPCERDLERKKRGGEKKGTKTKNKRVLSAGVEPTTVALLEQRAADCAKTAPHFVETSVVYVSAASLSF